MITEKNISRGGAVALRFEAKRIPQSREEAKFRQEYNLSADDADFRRLVKRVFYA